MLHGTHEESFSKTFFILIQPVEDPNNISGYMKSFFAHKTYLERDDPKLFRKIKDYLQIGKRPEKNRKSGGKKNQEERNKQKIDLIEC